MRSLSVTVVALLGFVGIVGVPLAARAQSGPAPAPYASLPAPYAPPPAPDPWAAPPPRGAPPFPGGPPPYGYGAPPEPRLRLMSYESDKKNEAVALLLEIFIPGVGSVYSEHPVGALVTWAGMVGGLALVLVGIDGAESAGSEGHANGSAGLIVAGVTAVLGFRVYGMVDAYSSAKDYNTRLAQRLGLSGVGLSLAPLRTPQGTALAPTLTLRF